MKLALHTAQAFSNAPRRTRLVRSVIVSRVDLPVAVGVPQLQVVERVLPTRAAPDPMVDVPGLLFHLQRLPAHHALASLLLEQVADPAPTRKATTLHLG